jgi:acetyl-CoA carboxylase biotin carboxyl carrier protein
MTKEILHYDNIRCFIEKLSEIAQSNDLAEIDFQENNVHIKITRNKAYVSQSFNPVSFQELPISQTQKVVSNQKNESSNVDSNNTTPTTNANDALKSPMVGLIYTAPNPESNDFVSIGSSVKKGDTVLLIEAMKVFNPIKAHKDGRISQILVKANEAVEFDQVLLIIE